MYISWIERDKILISQLSPQKFRYFPGGGDSEKNEFCQFSNAKMSFLNRTRKADEKTGIVCLVFMSLSWVMFLKLSKMWLFLQFFADVMKKSKAVIAIYVYASKSSRFALGKWYCLLCYDTEFRISILFLMFYSSISLELLLRPI